jgi:hypothetical protein
MRLIERGVSKCIACQRVLAVEDPLMVLPDALPDGHALIGTAGAALHWDCFACWIEREEFCRAWLEYDRAAAQEHQDRVELHDDEHSRMWLYPMYGQAERARPREEPSLRIVLKLSLRQWDILQQDWRSWLTGVTAPTEFEAAALQQAREALRTVYPTARSLLKGVDVTALVRRHRGDSPAVAPSSMPPFLGVSAQVLARARCPSCGAGPSSLMQVLARAPEGFTGFTCLECKHQGPFSAFQPRESLWQRLSGWFRARGL